MDETNKKGTAILQEDTAAEHTRNSAYSAEYSWFRTVSQYDLGLLGPELGVTELRLSSMSIVEVSMDNIGR